jgi:hypothetical protein
MKRKAWVLLCSCLVFLLPSIVHHLGACSINANIPVFSLSRHPDCPISAYARGNMGIVMPTFFTPYLLIAYRQMSGRPFSANELESLRTLWSQQAWSGEFPSSLEASATMNMDDYQAMLSGIDSVGGLWPVSFYRTNGAGEIAGAVSEWLGQRSHVVGVGAPPQISPYKGPSYSSYLVYSASSFTTASNTLKRLMESYGDDNPYIREWVQGQDQVYSISRNPSSIPAPLSEDAPAVFREHRAYQIASALFYAERFDEAIQAFGAISRDKDSPWRDWGDYLVARCLIREAGLQPQAAFNDRLDPAKWVEVRSRERQGRVDILRSAETRLRTVLANRPDPGVQRAAGQSLALVLFRVTPVERLV